MFLAVYWYMHFLWLLQPGIFTKVELLGLLTPPAQADLKLVWLLIL